MYIVLVYFIILVSAYTAKAVDNGSISRANACILPPPPDHGTYDISVRNGVPGTAYDNLVINVTCNTNYKLEGIQSVYCFSGWWPNPIPKCVSTVNNSQKKQCILPPYPTHGDYKTNIANPRPGTVHEFVNVNVTCNQGYTLRGASSIFCFNGWWTEKMPECAPLPIALSTLDNRNNCIMPEYPAHGTYTATIPGAKPGQAYDMIVAVNVTCSQGYVLTGPSLVYCSKGLWEKAIPQCVLPCWLTPHPSVTYRCVVSVQGVSVFRDCNEYEPSGTWAKPVCRKHYYQTNALAFMECSNGTWSNNLQKCNSDCGILTPNSQKLILNGTAAKLGEISWHAAIYRKTKEPYDLICGGSLVSTNIVITTAHCFWDDLLGQLPASDYVVAVGKLYRRYDSKLEDSTYKPQWSNVELIRLPERFRGRLTNFQDDIAVMRLSMAIEYRTYIRPICVDFDLKFEKAHLQPGNTGKVAGWGLTTDLGEPSQQLQVVDLPYVSTDTCFKSVPVSFYQDITSDKICAGYDNAGTAVCMGDSGGGLAFLGLDKGTPRYYLRGIVSTAPANDVACNANTYTTFTRVIKHEEFITRYWQD